MVQLRFLDAERCLAVADVIEDRFGHYGIVINPSADVAIFIRELRWLADNITKQPADLPTDEVKRVVHAILLVDQAENIAVTLAKLTETEIPNTKLKFLTKRLNRLYNVGDPKARDIFFELEVGGRLAKYPQLEIEFEEPDIVVSWPSRTVGLACKRVKSIKKMSKRIRDGAKQGAQSGIDFCVILGIDPLLTGDNFLSASSQEELESECDRRMNQLIAECGDGAVSAFEEGASGVILCGRLVGILRTTPDQPVSVFCIVRHKFIPNIELPGASAGVGALIDLMESKTPREFEQV